MKAWFRKHYHWVIFAIVFLEITVYGGLLNSMGVFLLPTTEDLGISRGNYALAGSALYIASFFGNLSTGFLFRRFGYKKLCILGLILSAAGMAVNSLAQGPVLIGAGRFMVGMGYGVCFTAGAVRIIQNWFHKHRGLLIGAVSMSSGLGGSLLTVLLTAVMEKDGWQMAALTTAALLVAVAVLYLLLHDKPESIGLMPYGDAQDLSGSKKVSKEHSQWEGFTLAQWLRSPAFYLMILCTLGSCVSLTMATSVIIPHFQDNGYSSADAAMYQSILMLSLAFIKLLFGGLCDRFGSRAVTLICLTFACLGHLFMSNISTPALGLAGILCLAVGSNMTALMVPLLVAPLFGYKSSTILTGVFLGVASLSSAFSQPLSNLLFDRIGSYSPVFRVVAIIDLVLIGMYLLLYALTARIRKKTSAAAQQITIHHTPIVNHRRDGH